jgi:predicted nucleic acid-binding protein
LVLPRDEHHQRAVALLGGLRREGVAVLCPLTSALELHRNLLYIKPPRVSQALQTVTRVLGLYLLQLPISEDVRAGLEVMGRYPDQSISLFDAITASMAKRLDARVLTFDHHHFGLMNVEFFG